MEISQFLLHMCIYFATVTVALSIIGIKGPRLMLQDYPKSIRDSVSPQTKQERLLGIVFGLPFLSVFIGYPLWLGFHVAAFSTSYWYIFKYVYGLLFLGNLYDLLVLDWLMFCFITPRFVVIPGTEGNPGYKDYRFHFIGFLKGLLITLVLGLILSGVVKLIA